MHRTKYFVNLGLTSILTIGCIVSTATIPASVQAKPAVTETSGSFKGADKPTQGKAHIVSSKRKRFLVLDDSFNTGNGPDLFILLHKSRVPQSYQRQEFVNLGRLQKEQGMQVYKIPSRIKDLSKYQSVVVWCKEFNVTFGYAELNQ